MDQRSAANIRNDGASLGEQLGAAINQGRFREASDLLARMPAAMADNADLMCLRAFVALQLGREAEAAELARKALAANPAAPTMHLVLGQALRGLGRREEAAAALLAAHREAPEEHATAVMLLEEAVAAYGLDGARPVYDEVAARQDRRLQLAWAKLAFRAGRTDALPAGVGTAEVMPVRDWLSSHGARPQFEGEREIIPIETPPVFGAPHEPDTYQGVEGYAPYAASLPDATIFAGSSLVFAPDGPALNDTFADPRYGRFLGMRFDPIVFDRDERRVLVDLDGVSLMQLEAGVMLSGWTSNHFGHWVPEFLCRLAYLEQHPRFAELPIIVDAGMPPQHLEYLQLLVSNPIVELPPKHALRCGELVVGSPSTFFPADLTPDHTVPPEHQGGLPLGGFRYLQARIAERLPPTPSAPRRKLYLSRKNRQWRLTVNEAEIAAAMAARGFEVLFPEDMSFEQQVRMFQSAGVVVAPGGSSVLNAIFAPEDVKLLILAQQNLFNWGTYYGLMRKLGYDLTMICGEAVGDPGKKQADFSVPVDHLLAALDALGA